MFVSNNGAVPFLARDSQGFGLDKTLRLSYTSIAKAHSKAMQAKVGYVSLYFLVSESHVNIVS